MKRILSAFLALAVSATLVVVATSWRHSLTAVHASGCSVVNATGNYGFTFSGFGTHSPRAQGGAAPSLSMGRG